MIMESWMQIGNDFLTKCPLCKKSLKAPSSPIVNLRCPICNYEFTVYEITSELSNNVSNEEGS